MLTYQIVVEADNVARHVIRHDDLLGKTYAAPGVSVLSKSYIDAYKAQYSLVGIRAVLVHLGVGDELSQEDLNGLE